MLEQLITLRPYSGEMRRQARGGEAGASQQEESKIVDTDSKKRRPFRYECDQDFGAQQCVIWEVLDSREFERFELPDQGV
jgi:hypothetical protein